MQSWQRNNDRENLKSREALFFKNSAEYLNDYCNHSCQTGHRILNGASPKQQIHPGLTTENRLLLHYRLYVLHGSRERIKYATFKGHGQ